MVSKKSWFVTPEYFIWTTALGQTARGWVSWHSEALTAAHPQRALRPEALNVRYKDSLSDEALSNDGQGSEANIL